MSDKNVPAVPEPKPVKFTCRCKLAYPLGAETTAYLYTKQEWFNHIRTTCPKCGTQYTVWNLTKAEMGQMAHNNILAGDRLKWKIFDFCDDLKIINEFCEDNHKKPPTDPWLSHRRQKEIDTKVAWFAYLLDHEL